MEQIPSVMRQALEMSWNHVAYLAAFGLVFVLIETRWPAVPSQHSWRAGSATDLGLSLLNPLVVWPVNVYLVVSLINLLLQAIGLDTYQAARGVWAAQPLLLQFVAALLVADFFSYWKHRLFHLRWLWPIHSVHHATTEVDWLTNDRDHPLQLAGTYFFVLTGLALCGFSNEMIAMQATVRRAYSLYTHANVDWSHGPLQRFLVSPALHRWHHAADERVIDRNFATMFAFWDVAFGSYAFPAPKPSAFGVPGSLPPQGIVQALRFPWGQYRALLSRLSSKGARPAVSD